MKHDWQSWIDRLKSDDLSKEDLRKFEAALREDPANVDSYMDALLSETALEAEHLPAPMAHVTPLPVQRHYGRVAAWAASVAALAAVAYIAGRSTVPPAPSPSTVPVAPEFFATITDADAAAEKTGIRIGQPLLKGELMVPDDSKIGIAMRRGARLEVHGPARLAIEDAEHVRMIKGRLRTYAPEYAHGFTIDTADGKAVDLGTRFVTATGAGRGTEIHVLEGMVEAFPGSAHAPNNLLGKQAAILKGGKLVPTEYLEQRLDVPLDPVLADGDNDGIPDVVEGFYGSDPLRADSKPAALRTEESFGGYAPGAIQGSNWQGNGTFLAEGLTYRSNGKVLKASGGALQTTGETGVGAVLTVPANAYAPQGVIYLSFLSQLPPVGGRKGVFGGLLLYQGDREELFVGKLSPYASYGARMKTSDAQDAFTVAPDTAPHLFVVRIDRTRLVTDVFLDPPLGQSESSVKQRMRYYAVPDFDRIAVRSGDSGSANFPLVFDEIRTGLTWDAVLPVAP